MAGFASRENIAVGFDAKIKIYVEGKDDEAILKDRWFGDRADFVDVEFESANGCASVVKAVETCDPEDWPQTFGLVDRDALMRLSSAQPWLDRLLMADDAEFRRSGSPHARVAVLVRWEIENYLLLDIDVLERTLSDLSERPGKRLTRERRAAWLCQHGNAIVPITAANICLHLEGKPQLKAEFGGTLDRDGILDALSTREITDLEQILARLDAFDDASASGQQRWDRLNRIVNGKVMLMRILRSKKCASQFGPARWSLASRMSDRDAIPAEIIEIIEDFRAAARDRAQ